MQPAPIFRPPGAADLDYSTSKTDMRYAQAPQQHHWRAPASSPSGYSKRTIAIVAAIVANLQLFSSQYTIHCDYLVIDPANAKLAV